MNNRLSIGLTLASRGVMYGLTTAPDLVRLAEIADESGVYDRVWVGDSLLGNPRLESISLLSAVAARTRRVNLGVACMASTPLRDPVLLATQWASLDQLAEGRTTFVACAGGGISPEKVNEARYYGIENQKQRFGRLSEAIQVIRRLWSGERVTFHGEYFNLDDVTIGIRPTQKPGIPIWIASDTPAESGLRRVARLGDGWMSAVGTPEEFSERMKRIQGYAAEYGRSADSYGNVLYSNIHVTDSANREAAYAESKRFLALYYGQEWPDEILRNWLVFGTPDECVTRLRQWESAGLQNITLRLCAWDQFGQIKRCIEEVLPKLRQS